jgi:hypothetical protein
MSVVAQLVEAGRGALKTGTGFASVNIHVILTFAARGRFYQGRARPRLLRPNRRATKPSELRLVTRSYAWLRVVTVKIYLTQLQLARSP